MKLYKKMLNIGLVLTMLSVMILPISVGASNSVSGNITNNIWTAENSPYIIDGTVEVVSGAKLTIQAGTIVRFNEDAKLLVKGRLEAIGEAGNEIIFTSNQSNPARSDWAGIEFADSSADAVLNDSDGYSSGNTIQYAIIKYGQGVVCDDTSPYLSNVQFLNNKVGLNIIGDNGSEGGEILLGDESGSVDVGSIFVSGNKFIDNGTGILINRQNSNSYVLTPAGKVWQGSLTVTAEIKNNEITSNGQGIVASLGDNNIIFGNVVKNNFGVSMQINAGSSNTVIEKNVISNNEQGIEINGDNTNVWRNNIKLNYGGGIVLSGDNSNIHGNNIYSNTSFDLENNVGTVDLSENYWGAFSASQAVNNITDENGLAVLSPIKTSLVDINELMVPTIDAVVSPTINTEQTISGTKTIGTAVVVNSNRITDYNNVTTWQYKMPLVIGNNVAMISLVDETGQESQSVEVVIVKTEEIVLATPVINNFNSETTRGSQAISGTKPAGSSIMINNGEVVSADSETSWNYELALTKGENIFSIVAKDEAGRMSETVSISITRAEIDVTGIISEEKSLTGEIDSKLTARVVGRLLLQVERAGLVWYVNPVDNKRYYITQENALDIFRKLALGITESDLANIPKVGKKGGNQALRNRLKGRFMLRVEAAGAVSYVDVDGYQHEVTMSNVMDMFRSLSLGISNNDIRKIEVGELD